MTDGKRKVGTIDLTPKWVGVLPIFIEGLLNGTAKGQQIAREELFNMARLADDRNERLAAPLDWRPVAEYVNAGPGVRVQDEPDVMIWHKVTGPVIGKLVKFPDGEIRAIVSGYHGYDWTMFATFNVPKV